MPINVRFDPAIALLAVGQTLVWAGLYYVFPASLLRWEADFGWTRDSLVLAITLAVFASAIFSPIAGRLIDKGFGPQMMGGSSAIGGLLLVCVSFCQSLWQFYALWVAIGVCLSGCLYEPCFAILTRARGASAKSGIIAITLVAGFAGTVSFPLIHFLAELYSWRGAQFSVGICVLVLVSPMLWFGAKLLGEPKEVPQRSSSKRLFLTSPIYWCLGISFALAAIAHGAALHHLLPMLDGKGVSNNAAIFAASLIGPMQVVGRLVMVGVGGFLSHRNLALLAFGFMGTSMLVLFAAQSDLKLIILFVVIFGAAYGTMSILRPVLAREILGEADFGSKSGALAFLYLTASASSAYVGALIWRVGGYDLMLMIMCFLAAFGAILFNLSYLLANRH